MLDDEVLESCGLFVVRPCHVRGFGTFFLLLRSDGLGVLHFSFGVRNADFCIAGVYYLPVALPGLWARSVLWNRAWLPSSVLLSVSRP